MGRRFPRFSRYVSHFKRRRRFGGGGGGALGSGDIGQEGVAFYGFTDFSEFSAGAGLPSGLTAYESGAGVTWSVANDGSEGNYVQGSNTDFGLFGFEYDAWVGQGLGNTFEMLARIWMPTPYVGNRRTWGPGHGLGGTAGSDLDFFGGGVYYRNAGTDQESTLITSQNGSAGVGIQSDFQEAEQVGVWAWQRVRMLFEATSANAWDCYIKTWFGGIGDEPGSFDGSSIGTLTNSEVEANDALGVATAALSYPGLHRVAYVSFTTDHTIIAPPTP